ncbi:kell blood group glycoprotein [Lampris incognitus]|uniref:kell blood group glycoprotein n=1 Tax=Lampris incognitus TaxID=2546036 RepID=UPI0024B49559|nr:kell blood group glycoprotein [Lampris incognitus]
MSENRQQPEPQSDPQHQPQTSPGEEAKPRWTSPRKLLILLLLGSSICASILGLLYYKQQNRHSKSVQITPCLSPACLRASARLSLSVDPFTQPCDYFLFTCGSDRPSPGTRETQRGRGLPGEPQSRGRRGTRSDRRKRESGPVRGLSDREATLLQYLREILESEPSGSAGRKARAFYLSCLDTNSIEAAGEEPFLTLIQKLGGWAVSGQWNKTDFNSTLSLLMRQYSTFPFFKLYVGRDPNETARGPTRKYIQIDQPDLLIPIEWNNKTQKSLSNAQTIRPFLASCQRYLKLLGAPSASISIHVGGFLSLSSELAVAAAPLSYRLLRGQLHQRMTIKELQDQAPVIDWLGSLQATFHPHPVGPEDQVLLHNLPYMVQMSRVIGKWLNNHELSSSGPLHTYMVLNLLHTFIPALDSRFAQTQRDLYVALGDTERVLPRWMQCVSETERGFDKVLKHLLREKSAHREEAQEMVQRVFSSLKSKLVDLRWRDESSRQRVMNKVHALTPRLWRDTEIPSEAELDQLYSEVVTSTCDYFANYIQLLSLQHKRRNQQFGEKEEADVLSVRPFVLGNELIIPMGMFVPPLFHPTYPRAMNYGVLGFLIAKDILHLLLPDIHRQSEAVQAVGECVWSHYLTVVENPSRDGELSLSAAQQQEVWVQHTALQVALQAYHHSLKSKPDDASLSGLSRTHLLLSSFSQVSCDTDPYDKFMPFEPSFLVTVICAEPALCPTTMTCPTGARQHQLHTC